jgi:hypothetical protein
MINDHMQAGCESPALPQHACMWQAGNTGNQLPLLLPAGLVLCAAVSDGALVTGELVVHLSPSGVDCSHRCSPLLLVCACCKAAAAGSGEVA